MSDSKTMSKAKKNRLRQKMKKTSDTEIENLELKTENPFVKSVSVETEKKEVNEQSKTEYINTALSEAQKLWDLIKKKSKDPKFIALPDKDKINAVSLDFHDFHKEFPIVSRYLICMGQYSHKAFKRYLIKIKNFKPAKDREKGYMEDQWIRRQADYVRYLWEAYQRGHYNQTEAKSVWQEAYQTLKKEFLDFKNMHADIEKDLENDKKRNKIELVSELMQRLSSGDQSLDEKNMSELLEVMKIQLFRQRKEKTMKEINNSVNRIQPSCESIGTAKPPPEIPLPVPDDFLKRPE